MKKIVSIAAGLMATIAASAQAPQFRIDAGAAGIPVPHTMYGIFFEDINFAADGGLYGELVKNRSFEFDDPLMGWKRFGEVEVRNDGPFERCPHYVRISYAGHPVMFSGIENEGFFGMGIEKGKEYRFSVWARTSAKSAAKKGKKSAAKPAASEWIRVALCDNNTMEEDQRFVIEDIEIIGSEWKKYEVVFTSPKTDPKATLRVTLVSDTDQEPWYRTDCCVDLEHISLFPVDVYNGDENGLRKDVAQTIADLKPGVFRFPGGCIVEGSTLETRYEWKKSVGPVENRPINMNRWEYTFDYRLFPDYMQSYGLGFYEYFRFAEEMGAEPLPVISVGMACQFQNDEGPGPHAALHELQPYIDDALDLIEFANGPATSKWGKVRADMGHPAPFNLKYLAVGNEQWSDEYVKRLEPFVKQIRAKYPDIKLVGSSGPYRGGEWFEELWPEMRRLGADLVDEHFYAPETFFENNADRYDNYERGGTKVFAGEYACHGADGHKFNHFNAALMEAAFMTGLERNADVVEMATYAPLLAHVEGWQWRPDLIWFDNLSTIKTCSYYVQQLYSLYKGTDVLPLTMDGKPVEGKDGQRRLYASAVKDTKAGEYIVKVANLSEYSQEVEMVFDNLPASHKLGKATSTSLHSENRIEENTIETPDAVVPVTTDVKVNGNTLKTRIGGRSFAVYRIKY